MDDAADGTAALCCRILFSYGTGTENEDGMCQCWPGSTTTTNMTYKSSAVRMSAKHSGDITSLYVKVNSVTLSNFWLPFFIFVLGNIVLTN